MCQKCGSRLRISQTTAVRNAERGAGLRTKQSEVPGVWGDEGSREPDFPLRESEKERESLSEKNFSHIPWWSAPARFNHVSIYAAIAIAITLSY
jgi:hypothetical protein